jgi:NADPH:quinone reductase-like Zn-dependent oxidoreductase
MQATIEDQAASTIPDTMKAAAISRFGGVEEITLQRLPVPTIEPDEILIQVESAGVGPWDPIEREGKFKQMMDGEPRFPYVLGSDGAGTVAAVGGQVTRFKLGDRVYAYGFMNPKGGFYAEYAAVKADNASPVPGNMTLEQAGAMPVDAITALRGLKDTLGLTQGQSVAIFGAGGGIGHMAVQFAKRMGARVLAVASGDDGVALAQRLGADASIDGRVGDVGAAVRAFACDGVDAALVTAGGRALADVLSAVRDGGRVAFPNGVEPAPKARAGIQVQNYDGTPDAEALETLNRLISIGWFEVHVSRTFPLSQAAEAHGALGVHHLGKLALRPTG